MNQDRFNGRSLTIGLIYDGSLDRYSGVPQYLAMLNRGLTRRGHSVTYLVGQSSAKCIGDCAVRSLSRNIRIRFNGNTQSVPVWSSERRIASALNRQFFDVVHVQVPYSPLLSARIIERLAPHTAVVGTFHINSEKHVARAAARILAFLTRSTLRRFDRIVAVSRTASRFAAETFGLDELSVIPNMVDVAAIRSVSAASMRPPAFGPRLVYVGALVPRKGPIELIKAFGLVHQAMPTATLAVAGDGPLRPHLERLVRNRGLASAVTFLGPIGESAKALLFAQADIACFPSRFGESFGIVLLEAIAAGAGVVVGGRNEGYIELLEDCSIALVDPKDQYDFAKILTQFASDGPLRDQIQRAQRKLLGRFDVDRVTEEILVLYEEAMAARREACQVNSLGHASGVASSA